MSCLKVWRAIPGGDDVRKVQLAGYCKHAVCVCDDGETAGGADDEAAAGAGSSSRRRLQTRSAVGLCEYWGKAGEVDDEAGGAAGGGDTWGIHLAATSVRCFMYSSRATSKRVSQRLFDDLLWRIKRELGGIYKTGGRCGASQRAQAGRGQSLAHNN
jgi:hypothetical protein